MLIFFVPCVATFSQGYVLIPYKAHIVTPSHTERGGPHYNSVFCATALVEVMSRISPFFSIFAPNQGSQGHITQ